MYISTDQTSLIHTIPKWESLHCLAANLAVAFVQMSWRAEFAGLVQIPSVGLVQMSAVFEKQPVLLIQGPTHSQNLQNISSFLKQLLVGSQSWLLFSRTMHKLWQRQLVTLTSDQKLCALNYLNQFIFHFKKRQRRKRHLNYV